MNDHDEGRQPDERKPPKHAADEAGRSWLEEVQAARVNTERKREAKAQMLEAWGVREDDQA